MVEAKLTIDERGPVLIVVGEGLYDAALVERHAHALRRATTSRRGQGVPVRVLVDLTRSLVQKPSIAQLLAEQMRAIYQIEDRVAVLCTSPLHAMQVRRANAGGRYVTASKDDAMRYLTE